MGEWRGVAIAPDGDLWVGGKWSAGKILYVAENSGLHADGSPDPSGPCRQRNSALIYRTPATSRSFVQTLEQLN